MRALVQRVSSACVLVEEAVVGQIDAGMLVLLGVAQGDDESDVEWMTEKLVHLRIFADENDKMNRSLLDVGGSMLVVSQFTLLGDCRKGRRPSFVGAAEPEVGNRLYERFVETVRLQGVPLATGQFGCNMQVSLTNDGPVTLLVESPPKS